MGAEVDPYPSRQHPPHSALQCPGKNRPDFFKDKLPFYCKTAVPTLPSSSLLYWFSANKKKSQFSTPTMAAIPGLGYLSIAFIYSVGRAIQLTIDVNTFAWRSVGSTRKQCLQYICTSKLWKMRHLRTLVRQSRSECFSLLGCQRQPCEQRAGGLKTDSLAAEDFTMPGFLNFSHPLWFPPFRIPIYPQPWRGKKGGGGWRSFIRNRWFLWSGRPVFFHTDAKYFLLIQLKVWLLWSVMHKL